MDHARSVVSTLSVGVCGMSTEKYPSSELNCTQPDGSAGFGAGAGFVGGVRCSCALSEKAKASMSSEIAKQRFTFRVLLKSKLIQMELIVN